MKRWSALLFGSAIGAGLAMVFAPRSGKETRRRITQSVDELLGRTQSQFEQGRLRATELMKTGQERATELAQRLQEALPSERSPTPDNGEACQIRPQSPPT